MSFNNIIKKELNTLKGTVGYTTLTSFMTPAVNCSCCSFN